jgi:hypothetical protein
LCVGELLAVYSCDNGGCKGVYFLTWDAFAFQTLRNICSIEKIREATLRLKNRLPILWITHQDRVSPFLPIL